VEQKIKDNPIAYSPLYALLFFCECSRDWSRNREQRSSFMITILIPKKLPPFSFQNGFVYTPLDGDTTSQKIGTFLISNYALKLLLFWWEEKSDLPRIIYD
jgi:hypothetical protein